MSERIMVACGNDCSVCPRYIKEPYVKTETELAHTAELWYKIGYRDHVVTNEERRSLTEVSIRASSITVANIVI